jgi:hypothetical protein
MKKIFLLAIFSSILVNSKAQIVLNLFPILQNIENNKDLYIGQAYSHLSSSLNIPIEYFSPQNKIHNRKNDETSTKIAFYFPINADELHLTYPRLEIYWQTALDFSVSEGLYRSNDGGRWVPAVQAFYNNAIISDIKVRQ